MKSLSPSAVCVGTIVATLLPAAETVARAQADSSHWLTGKALEQQLRQRVPTIHWREAPFREAIGALARASRVAVLIDRRVDPGQPLTLSLENVALGEIFRCAAESRGLAMAQIGAVFYFGPLSGGPQLETAMELRREEVRGFAADVRRPLLEARTIRWNDFAEPRALLTQLVRESGIELLGLEQVPHDLWAAADLPPLALVDRLGLIVGQFNLTLGLDASGRRITLVPIPNDVAVAKTYPGGPNPEETVQRWRNLAPTAHFEIVGDKVRVRGLLAEHRRITPTESSSHRPGSKRDESSASRTRFTVREAKGSLRQLLEELAGRLDLEVRLDEPALKAAGISPDQQVSLSVHDATLEGLFDALLRPAGCEFVLNGKTLLVRPAKSSGRP